RRQFPEPSARIRIKTEQSGFALILFLLAVDTGADEDAIAVDSGRRAEAEKPAFFRIPRKAPAFFESDRVGTEEPIVASPEIDPAIRDDRARFGLARRLQPFGDAELSLGGILVAQRANVEAVELAVGIGVEALADVEMAIRDEGGRVRF